MIEKLARYLFDRQAAYYEADQTQAELAWIDPGIRGFWIDEAAAIVAFLGLEAKT